MLAIFVFNVLFWMFFGRPAVRSTSSPTRSWTATSALRGPVPGAGRHQRLPVAWFQSVNSVAIIALAPVLAWLWVKMGKNNPIIPRKFGLGLIFNSMAFLLLMVALSSMVDDAGKIPVLDPVHGLRDPGRWASCALSPIGLSMTTKLAPARLAGLAMGCWFLSIAIGQPGRHLRRQGQRRRRHDRGLGAYPATPSASMPWSVPACCCS